VDEQAARWLEQSVPTKRGLAPSRPRGAELKKLSDLELMNHLRNGDQEALSHLFDRYYRLVLSIASRIVRDRGEAEDLMQETFFELYRLVERYDSSKGTVKVWIVQLAYHKSLNRRRYLSLRGAFDERQAAEFDPADVPATLGAGGFAEDLMPIVRKGLETLSEKQRETVESVCFDGLLFSEIAEQTKESLGNVRHHYYRGIERLRKYVKDSLSSKEDGSAAHPGGEE
jgi:RNA polymerase sigma-70 factor (ECF subfamily)